MRGVDTLRVSRNFTLVLVAMLVITQLAGCSTAKPEPEQPKGGTFIFPMGAEAQQINPILANGNFAVRQLFDTLVARDEDGNWIGKLAESFQVSEDGLVYTFKLRENVKWHDGEPFTAEDVKFTCDTVLDEKTLTNRRSCLVVGDKPIEVEVIDEHTVRFTLPEFTINFLSNMALLRYIPKHLLEGKDVNTDEFNQNPIGTGPFKFTEWKKGEYLIMSRNDDYFLPVQLDRYILKIIPSAEAQVIALEKGEIDCLLLQGSDIERLKSNPDIVQYNINAGYNYFLYLNIHKAPLDDVKVRQAIAYAIDRESMASTVTYGSAKGAYGLYDPAGPLADYYNHDAPEYRYNIEEAKRLLAEAGWTPGSDGILEKDGQKFVIEQIITAANEKVATMLQSDLAKVGIKMDIRMLDNAAYSAALRLDPESPDAPWCYVTANGPTNTGDPDYYDTFHTKAYGIRFNYVKYSNPRVDELLDKGLTILEKEARIPIYKEFQQIVMEELPMIPLYQFVVVFAVRSRVGGLPEDRTADANGIVWEEAWRLYIKPETK